MKISYILSALFGLSLSGESVQATAIETYTLNNGCDASAAIEMRYKGTLELPSSVEQVNLNNEWMKKGRVYGIDWYENLPMSHEADNKLKINWFVPKQKRSNARKVSINTAYFEAYCANTNEKLGEFEIDVKVKYNELGILASKNTHFRHVNFYDKQCGLYKVTAKSYSPKALQIACFLPKKVK
ncbi:hypothetical protein [Shewanella surugensis]|uniref:Uncharacterized protein n=1 Tax=Shewanella surugensis TaxID=212020 RepID=A0ABT0LAV5_9GAMM|nr:hypothetical protein [Shewanella surugensis]MCL1124833.1 hypothetical protein [Shewanella surugensis]